MSTVLPNGRIRFLSNVPLDLDYENSIDFLTIEEQTAYFIGLTPIHEQIGATRVRDGVISVNAVSDSLLPCNYIMFQNQNFSTKWFYAFVTNVEYVNNNMTYIYYKIDDIQTWLFDGELEECFVEREHTTTDGMFEHLINENFDVGDYVNDDLVTNEFSMEGYNAWLFYYGEFDTSEIVPKITSPDIKAKFGNLNGLNVSVFSVQDYNGNWYEINNTDPEETPIEDWNGLELLNYFIKLLTDASLSETIVGLVLIPKILTNDVSDDRYAKDDLYVHFNNFNSAHGIDGYNPKNNKLYNYPYCYIEVGTSEGEKITLEPQYLLDGQNELKILTNISPVPSVMVVPLQYKGNNQYWEKTLTFNSFQNCAVAIDSYKAWVASGGAMKLTVDTANNFANSFVTAMTPSMQGETQFSTKEGFGMIGGVQAVGDAVVKSTLAHKVPPVIKGGINTQPLSANQLLKIYTREMTINHKLAEAIDDYFTMFGYKVNRVKTPSRRNRPHYTYVKTKGCKFIGGAPSDAIERIQAIYNNGIRFWVNPSEVGHYTTIDNSPV